MHARKGNQSGKMHRPTKKGKKRGFMTPAQYAAFMALFQDLAEQVTVTRMFNTTFNR